MIGFVEGKLIERHPTRAVISCAGVGYEVAVPLSTFDRLPDVGQSCRILTRLVVREDAHLLFGFSSHEERTLFDQLCSVSRVGPKLALSVLSGLSVPEIKGAIAKEDAGRLASISGVGKLTAQRICVELKDKVSADGALTRIGRPGGEGIYSEAVTALIVLGYSRSEAQDAVERAMKKSPGVVEVEELVRHALGSPAR